MGHRIDIKKGLFGRLTVGYDCPHCAARLKSPLDDAGKSDTCPECGIAFVVPGTEELRRIESEEAAAAQRIREEEARRKQEQDQHRKVRIEAAEQQRVITTENQRIIPNNERSQAQTGSPVRSGPASELEFFNEGGVAVTNTRFVVTSQTYAMRNVTSFRFVEYPPSLLWPIAFLLICLIITFGCFVSGQIAVGLLFSVLAVFAGIWMAMLKPTYAIVLATSAGEVRAIQDQDKAFIQRIVEALNRSIMSHA